MKSFSINYWRNSPQNNMLCLKSMSVSWYCLIIHYSDSQFSIIFFIEWLLKEKLIQYGSILQLTLFFRRDPITWYFFPRENPTEGIDHLKSRKIPLQHSNPQCREYWYNISQGHENVVSKWGLKIINVGWWWGLRPNLSWLCRG